MHKLFRFNDWPIRTKLIVVMVLIVTVTMTGAMGVATYSLTRAREQQLKVLLGTLAEAQAHNASEMLSAQLVYLRAGVATGIVLREDTVTSNDSYSGSDSEIRAELLAADQAWREAPETGSELVTGVMDSRSSARLKNSADLTPVLLDFVLTDSRGALVAASTRPDRYFYGDNVWWQQGWNSGQGAVFIGQVVHDQVTGISGVELAVPIVDPETGQAVGVLRAVYNLETLASEMQEVHVGRTGHIELIAPDGTAIISQHESAGAPVAYAPLLGEQLFAPTGGADLDVPLEDGRGSMIFKPVILDQDTFGAAQPGWVLVIHQDREEAYGPVTQIRFILLVTMLVTIAASAVASVFLARVLTRQVLEIEELFSAVAVGDFAARARVISGDEMGRIASGVNAMLEQIGNLLSEVQQSAEQRFSDVTLTLSDWVWEMDAEGRYTYCSDRVRDVLGYNREEILGRTRFDLMPSDEADRLRPVFGQMIASKQPLVNLEHRAVAKNGDTVYLRANAVPIVGNDGSLVGYRGSDNDVTEQKRSEEAIQNAYAELDQIFNTAAGGMRLVGQDLRMIRVNEPFCAMAGIALEDAANKRCYEVFSSDICRTSNCTLRRLMAGEKIIESEVVKQRADGSSLPCYLTATPFYGANGELIGIVEDFRDITRQKQAEEQIRQQNETLNLALNELSSLSGDVEKSTLQVMDASQAMSGMIHLLIEQAAASAATAQNAATSAQEGDQVIGEMVGAMERIRDNTQETTRRIKRLGEVSQSISEMVRLIEDLSDRTTVLALNAAIQAAAAGEAGRGFAVVAEEVQRLAERATSATRQIEQMVKGIQAETNEATVSIAEVTREVVDGSRLAQTAGERMGDLNRQVESLASLIEHITETTSQQTNESLDVLANLSNDLQTSVRALRSTGIEPAGGNGSKLQAV